MLQMLEVLGRETGAAKTVTTGKWEAASARPPHTQLGFGTRASRYPQCGARLGTSGSCKASAAFAVGPILPRAVRRVLTGQRRSPAD